MTFVIRPVPDPEGDTNPPWARMAFQAHPSAPPSFRRPIARIELTVIGGRRVTAVHLECRTFSEAATLAELLASLLAAHAEAVERRILIQGDHRERLRRELKRKGYRVKG
jgi:translation initiation factor 1 (eIF-1/SUI1)